MYNMKKQMTRVALLALSVFIACQPAKKNNASIHADIKGLTDSVVFITRMEGDSSRTDTVPAKNGVFTWTGQLKEPEKMYISTRQRYMQLFMENVPVQIKGTTDSFYYSEVTGSAAQDEYKAFQNSLKDLTDVEYSLYPKLHEAKEDEKLKASLETQLDELRLKRRGRMKEYIQTHPASAISVSLIEDMAMMGEFAPLDTLYRLLDPKAQQTAMGQRLGKRLEVLKRSAIGEPIKDFTQLDAQGKPVKISDYKGKYLFVDFWASWCGPCRAENPNVLKAWNTFKDKRFAVLGISLDDNADKWKEAIQKDGMPWTQLSDLKGYKNEIADYYGIQAIPYSFLLDTNGIIIAKGLRGTQLHSKLSEILY